MAQTLAEIANALIQKRESLRPEINALQARIDAAAKKVSKFIEKVEDEGGWEWSEEWEWSFITSLDEIDQRVQLENLNEDAVTFMNDDLLGAFILPYTVIDEIDAVIAKGEAEWAGVRAEMDAEEADEATSREERKRELLEELAEIEFEERQEAKAAVAAAK